MIHAVIMAGGEGKRFWPLSRKRKPKQFLQIISEKTLLEDTVHRLDGLVSRDNTFVITSKDHSAGVRKILTDLPHNNVIGEPCPRDTAPCVGLAAALILSRSQDGIMITLPADQAIKPVKKFQKTLSTACSIANKENCIVTIGIKPTRPATGYGYIYRGKPFAENKANPSFEVQRFKEKPPLNLAKRYVSSGKYYWNSGIFVWKASVIMDAFRKFKPEMYKHLAALQPELGTKNQDKAIAKAYKKLEKISIDYAIMEKVKGVKVVESSFEWDDVGSWSALFRHHQVDKHGNLILSKDVITLDTEDCLIFQKKEKNSKSKRLIAAAGIKNIIVIDTPDALLVCHKAQDQDTKKLVDQILNSEFY